MNSLNENDLRKLVKSILFENQVNERYMPDDFPNSRTTMYDRPGPQINGQENKEQEEEIIMPLVADDYVTNTAYLRRDHRVRDDEEYVPQNPAELGSAFVTLIDDYKNDEAFGNKDIHNIWISVKKILSKV